MYDIQLVCKYPSNFLLSSVQKFLFISIIDLNSNLTVLISILQFVSYFATTHFIRSVIAFNKDIANLGCTLH